MGYKGPSKTCIYIIAYWFTYRKHKISIENKKVFSISKDTEPLIEVTTYLRPTLFEYFSRLTFKSKLKNQTALD